MATTTTNDLFAKVIGDLGRTLSTAQSIGPSLRKATTIVVDLDDGLHAIGDINSVLKAIQDALKILNVAVGALSPIPVVGQIADTFDVGVLQPANIPMTEISTTLDRVYKEVVKPAIGILDDIQKGLVSITKVVSQVTITVPQYLNTIQVLSYLLDVAQPLAGMLKGSPPGERLNQVVDTLQKVKHDVDLALTPFAKGLDDIEKSVDPFFTDLSKIFDNMGSGAKQAIADLKAAGEYLKCIASNFDKVIDAMAPVRWALDTIDYIVNKILMPVVNWILKVTTLQNLIDNAKDEVLKKLGIGPILDAVKSVDPKDLQSSGGSVNARAGSNSATALKDFGTALGEYRTNKSEALRDATFGLVTAITGTPIDPNKTSTMARWPPVPNLDGNRSSTAALVAFGFGHADPHGQLRRRFQSAQKVHSAVASSGTTAPMSLLVLATDQDPAPVPPIDPTKWPQSAAFVQSVHDAIGIVRTLSQKTSTLGTSLKQFESSLSLPSEFDAQMSALATSFKTCDDTIVLLAKFKLEFLNKLVDPVDQVIKSQLADVNKVTVAIPKFQAAVQELSTAASGVIAEMPKAELIDTIVHRMDGWVLGLQQLVEIMEQGYARTPMDTHVLDAGRIHIETSAKSLGARLNTMSKTVSGLTPCVSELQDALDRYSDALSSISAHSEKISTNSLPNIQHVAVILGKIDSIFDPLSSLLEAGQCVDAGASQKKTAQIAVDMMVKAAQENAAPPPSAFTALIESFAAKELPLGEIATAVATATTDINTKSVKAFRTHAESVKNSLDDLTQALKQTQTYKFTAPTSNRVYETPNDLVDQNFVDQALKHFKA